MLLGLSGPTLTFEAAPQATQESLMSALPSLDDTLAVEPAAFKSPKVSSLFRSVEQQRLIGLKLPGQIRQT